MGRARRNVPGEGERRSVLLQEAERLGAASETIDYLQELEEEGNGPRTPREARAVQRTRMLIRGRGWPTDRIEVFFSDREDVHLPHMISANAVLVPREYSRDLSETSLARIIVHEMVHSRAAGLPSKDPIDFSERLGLYQTNEAITEMIAESILPASGELRNRYPLLQHCREWVEGLCGEASLSVDDLERLSSSEALQTLANALGWSLDDLSMWMEKRLAEHRQTLLTSL